MAKTYVILLNYCSALDTIECLETVLRMEGDFHTIVVDNDSPDDSVQLMLDWSAGKAIELGEQQESLKPLSSPPIGKPLKVQRLTSTSAKLEADSDFTLYESPKNGGFAAGNNLAIELAKAQGDADYYWLLNNDTVVPADALQQLVQCFEGLEQKGEKPGILGSKLRFYSQPDVLQGIGARLLTSKARVKQVGTLEKDNGQFDDGNTQIDAVIGASMFVSKAFINEVGLMATDYFLYYEELDWAARAKSRGFSVTYAPNSIVYHKQGASTGNYLNGSKNPCSMFYHYRNLLRFYGKFHPAKWPIAATVVLLRIMKRASGGDLAYFKLLWPVFMQRECPPSWAARKN